MSQPQAAVGPDRLPWLNDELPAARSKSGRRELLAWGFAASLLVAGSSFWLGSLIGIGEPVASDGSATPTVTTKMPAPRAAPIPQVAIAPIPQVRTVVVPVVRFVPAPQIRYSEREGRPRVEESAGVASASQAPANSDQAQSPNQSASAQVAAPAVTPPVAAVPRPLTLWPARQSAGAYGRLVQIGAFGSRYQAKRGWWAMVRAYPGVRKLPAVVTETRNSRGRRFYRFQIGTTSQAHSEVLCQRMEKITFSCAVVGLPWKPKGVER
jgi:hypothetical protein